MHNPDILQDLFESNYSRIEIQYMHNPDILQDLFESNYSRIEIGRINDSMNPDVKPTVQIMAENVERVLR